jgi:hypothetical protein
MYDILGGGVVGLYIFMYNALMTISENYKKCKVAYLLGKYYDAYTM